MRCVSFDVGEREAKRQTGTNFIPWMPILEFVAYGEVEIQIVPNLPDQTYQTRDRMRLAKFVLVEHFRDRSKRPPGRPFKDGGQKNVAVMVAGESGLGVQKVLTMDDPLEQQFVASVGN